VISQKRDELSKKWGPIGSKPSEKTSGGKSRGTGVVLLRGCGVKKSNHLTRFLGVMKKRGNHLGGGQKKRRVPEKKKILAMILVKGKTSPWGSSKKKKKNAPRVRGE